MTLTLSPGLSDRFVQPARVRLPGLVNSIPHIFDSSPFSASALIQITT